MPSFHLTQGRHDKITCLLWHGADVNLPDGQGLTPLSQAAALSSEEGPRILKALIRAGAKLDGDTTHNIKKPALFRACLESAHHENLR